MSAPKKLRSREHWKTIAGQSTGPTDVLVLMNDLIGKKWYLPLLYTLSKTNSAGFNELKREIDGVSNKMLSKSLEELENEHGLVEREVVNEKPFRVEYSVTDQGRSLEPVLNSLQQWGREYLA